MAQESKCVLSLTDKDAAHAVIGLIQGDAGTLAADTGYRLERLAFQAKKEPVECSLGDVATLYRAMWGYRERHGCPQYLSLDELA